MAWLFITHPPPTEIYVLRVGMQYHSDIKITVLAFSQQNVNAELLLYKNNLHSFKPCG